MIDYKELSVFTPNAEAHVQGIISTFTKTVNHNGKDSFIPMCIYLNSEGDVKLAITSRPWNDKDDMYKAYSEMLFAFSAINSKCLVFANDVRVTKYESEAPHSKTMEAQDALNIAFVSKDSSALVSIPYTVRDNNTVEWHEELSVTSPLSKDNPAEVYQGDMVELFYVMSHIDNSPFTPAQLMNYYSLKGFTYQLADDALVEKVKIEVNTNDNTD